MAVALTMQKASRAVSDVVKFLGIGSFCCRFRYFLLQLQEAAETEECSSALSVNRRFRVSAMQSVGVFVSLPLGGGLWCLKHVLLYFMFVTCDKSVQCIEFGLMEDSECVNGYWCI